VHGAVDEVQARQIADPLATVTRELKTFVFNAIGIRDAPSYTSPV
jgi:hypothetical protein